MLGWLVLQLPPPALLASLPDRPVEMLFEAA